jgi:hypothetical protein
MVNVPSPARDLPQRAESGSVVTEAIHTKKLDGRALCGNRTSMRNEGPRRWCVTGDHRGGCWGFQRTHPALVQRRRPVGCSLSALIDSRYVSGRSPYWLKMKNPASEAARREAEEA